MFKTSRNLILMCKDLRAAESIWKKKCEESPVLQLKVFLLHNILNNLRYNFKLNFDLMFFFSMQKKTGLRPYLFSFHMHGEYTASARLEKQKFSWHKRLQKYLHFTTAIKYISTQYEEWYILKITGNSAIICIGTCLKEKS